MQRKELAERRNLYGWGDEVALAVAVDSETTGTPRRPPVDREATFHYRLRELLAPIGGKRASASTSVLRWFRHLQSFAFEASENTWDHGRIGFDGRPIRSVRFVKLRRIHVGRQGFDLHGAVPGFEEAFGRYIEALRAARDLGDVGWDRSGGTLIEVTIADGGVGIAARMAGGLDVYEAQLAEETRHVLNALLPDKTTKPAGEVGRGQGFRKMLRACHQLSGLTIIRTGRLRLSRTYRQLDGLNEDVDFNDARSRAYVPDSNEMPLPLLAGTSVSLIFPAEMTAARRSATT
jgi:hypothetical protein